MEIWSSNIFYIYQDIWRLFNIYSRVKSWFLCCFEDICECVVVWSAVVSWGGGGGIKVSLVTVSPWPGQAVPTVPMLGLTVSVCWLPTDDVCSSRDEAVCTLYYAWICSTTQPLLGDHNVTVTTMLPQSWLSPVARIETAAAGCSAETSINFPSQWVWPRWPDQAASTCFSLAPDHDDISASIILISTISNADFWGLPFLSASGIPIGYGH